MKLGEIKMETKIKYLGQFELTTILNEEWYPEFDEDVPKFISVFMNINDLSDYYESDLFMRHSENIEGIGEIHGICGETNTSSIVLQLNEDDSECVKLWRIW
jgi:hypothetical protein